MDPAANDAFWAALRSNLLLHGVSDAPKRLERDLPLPRVWSDPELLFSQICGAPYAAGYADQLTLIGTPHYAAPGCDGAYHRSFVIVNRASPARDIEDLSGACVAVNDRGSNTGFNLLGDWLSPLSTGEPFFARLVISGAHMESMRLVAEGAADVASIDCVTHAFLARHHPELVSATRILARTALTPAPPWVVSRSTPRRVVEALRDALRTVLSSPRMTGLGSRLLLQGFSELPAASYRAILESAQRARSVMPSPETSAPVQAARCAGS
ncbi:MAG TPA: PhnD/SsuA/transferrin family substrate-binding protein [Polyangiaceae bacterium]|nr:PhnD/SsuA/transferrin family substrate-binding protein [Polyangiaceae bacterium]